MVVTQPELLAQHCSEGGMIFDAVDYYLLASQRATAALNTLEASAHLRRGERWLTNFRHRSRARFNFSNDL